MTEINWQLGQPDPNAQARAYKYADEISRAAGMRQAGQKFASGDYKGAAADVASQGDIQGAMQVQGYAQKQTDQTAQNAQAAYEYIGRALPVLQKIAEVHAGDPDGGAGALSQAFDQMAPEISQVTGHNDQALATFRQHLVADPKGTIARVQAMLPSKVEKLGAGDALVRTQGGNATPVYSQPSAPKPPTVHTFTEGDKTVDKQWNPETNSWEVQSSGPRYKPSSGPTQGFRLLTDAEKSANGLPKDGVYQVDARGKIDRVAGNTSVRPIPAQALAGIQSNRNTLRKIDQAISALKKTPNSVGLQTYAGDQITQRIDPEGVPVRALVADIGSQKLHDRSGAAVTISEAPRLQPFIPSVHDRADNAIKKLEQLKAEYQSNMSDAESFYSPDAGYMTLPSPASAPAAPGKPASVEDLLKKYGHGH